MTSNLTPEQLADAVANIAALANKQPTIRFNRACSQGGVKYITFEWDSLGILDEPLIGDVKQFIATAPLMAQVIRQLWAERAANRAVMEQAREALSRCYNVVDWPADGSTSQDAALAALDAALGGV